MHYAPRGVCAIGIDFEVRDQRVYQVKFIGGCDGNHKGLSALVEGMLIDEVIDRLSGIKCGMKSSSCPDQLAKALIEYKSKSV